MAQNDNLTQLDSAQAIKRTFDPDHDAVRVVQALNTEVEIELSAEDGDSVESLARAKMVLPSDGATDCSQMRKVCKFGVGGITEVSADGQDWITLSISEGEIKDLCAMQIRVSDGKLVIRS